MLPVFGTFPEISLLGKYSVVSNEEDKYWIPPPETYRQSIAKNIVSIDSYQEKGTIEDDILDENYEKVKKLQAHFSKLGEKCKSILNMFYYKKSSMQDIALAFNYEVKTQSLAIAGDWHNSIVRILSRRQHCQTSETTPFASRPQPHSQIFSSLEGASTKNGTCL